jgi:hypothetical protein
MNLQEQQEEMVGKLLQSPWVLLVKQAAAHLGVWLLAFSMFAATDSWMQLTGWQLAGALATIVAALAGFLSANLLHEWSHFLGAKLSGGKFTVNARLGFFVFDWDFADNTVKQFYVMSVAGSLGGLLAVLLLWLAVEPDSLPRVALVAGGLAAFVFGSIIEWPVLRRVRLGGDPLGELSKISPAVLARAATGSAIAFALGLAVL